MPYLVLVLALFAAQSVSAAVPLAPRSGPFSGSPEQAARAALSQAVGSVPKLGPHGGLALRDVHAPRSGGHVVRFAQTYRGLTVLHAVVAVRLDADGYAVRVASSAAPIAELDIEPKVDAVRALRSAREGVRFPLPAEERGGARLAVLPFDGGRLVWEVAVATALPIHSIVALVDAKTGKLLSVTDLARRLSEGRVFADAATALGARKPDGSFKTDTLSDVELKDLLSVAEGQNLEGKDIVAFNCCPNEGCDGTSAPKTVDVNVPYGPVTVKGTMVMCDEMPLAAANADGNFFYAPEKESNVPSVVVSNTGPGRAGDFDKFAEVMAYHHAQSMLEYVRTLDPYFELPDAPGQLRVTANFLLPNIEEALENFNGDFMNPRTTIKHLMRMGNAMYAPKGSFDQIPIPGMERPFDSLILFQGPTADFAYDPHVIAHEVGHAVVARMAGLLDLSADDWGIVDAPGAMNEGFADYFASVRENDPRVGEYVGPFSGSGEGQLRDLENTFSCPTVIKGEVHQDSQHFSAALWQVRKAVAAGQNAQLDFDAAVLTALGTLTPLAGFDDAAAAVTAEIGLAFPQVSKATVEGIFASRGVSACERVIDVPANGVVNDLQLAAVNNARKWKPYAPGPVQLRFAPPAGATAITVQVNGSAGGGGGGLLGGGLPGGGSGNDPKLGLLLKNDQRIVFSYGAEITSDASPLVKFVKVANDEASVRIELEPGCGKDEIYAALANQADSTWAIDRLAIAYEVDDAKAEECVEEEPEPSDDGADDGSGGGGGGGGDARGVGGSCGSCSGAGPAGLLSLAALLLRAGRRRLHG